MKLVDKENLIIKLALIFYISSFIGYIYELILCYIYTGKIFSHGILFGPWLPIYGVGSIILMSLYKFKKNPLIIFTLSFFITGILEYFTGLFLLKVLKMRLWDYTVYFLNIGGHVCFLSALCFGIGGLLVIYLLYPFIKMILKKVNKKLLKVILSIITIVFLGDIIASILK